MPFVRHCTATIAVLFAAAGTLAAQNAVVDTTAAGPQVAAASAPVAPAEQQASDRAPAPAAQAVSFVPFAANATVGVHSKSSDMPAPFVPPRANKHNQAVTLMIIGGAALLGGAIIGGSGGTLIAVGGIVVGAIGLYQYLQ